MAPKPSNMAPSWEPRRGHTKCFSALLRGLGSSWAKMVPKMAPRPFKKPPRIHFGPILDNFLLIFHWFLIDFVSFVLVFCRWFLTVPLLVCCLVALLVCWRVGFVGLLLVCWISLPQARWRGWPAGQVDTPPTVRSTELAGRDQDVEVLVLL